MKLSGGKMIFQDSEGNKFTWSVNCFPKPVENKKTKCIHCKGHGRLADYDYHFSYRECDWCNGSGQQDVRVSCYDKDLEKYLEQFIEQYYKEKKFNFLGENI